MTPPFFDCSNFCFCGYPVFTFFPPAKRSTKCSSEQTPLLAPTPLLFLPCLLCSPPPAVTCHCSRMCLPRPSFHLSTKPAPDCFVVFFAFGFQALKFAALPFLYFPQLAEKHAPWLVHPFFCSFWACEPYATLLLCHALWNVRPLARFLPSYPLFRVHLPDAASLLKNFSTGCKLSG